MWPESGAGAAEESVAKSPALGTLLSDTSPGEGVILLEELDFVTAGNPLQCSQIPTPHQVMFCRLVVAQQPACIPLGNAQSQACAGHYCRKGPCSLCGGVSNFF